MNEDREENDYYISHYEQQCINQLDNEQDLEKQLLVEKDLVNHNLWCSFQDTATAIAHLYKERVQDASSLWIPFQTAAGTVTSMYKNCGESMKKVSDMSIQCGYQRRNKELLQWVRKKRRTIRREDLLSYLSGKPPPPHRTPPHHHHHHHRASSRPRFTDNRPLEVSPTGAPLSISVDDNLSVFSEALAISRRHRNHELTTFLANEFARNCMKRQASPSPTHDVNMDSPTLKKCRLL